MTEYEHRFWVKLQAISDLVMPGYHPPAYRCSWQHAKEVCDRIRKDMPNDRLLGNPRTSTIKDYFERFCHECREFTAQEYARLHAQEPFGDGATGLSAELKEAMLQRLEERIQQLDEPLRGVVQASLQPDKGAEYRRRDGMESGDFERLLRLAKRELRRRLDPEE